MPIALFIALLCGLVPFPLAAAEFDQLGSPGVPVNLKADSLSYDRGRDIYRASGDVHLLQGDFEVFGEQLEWSPQSGVLEAQGQVRLIAPNEVLSGSRARYNLRQNTGIVEDGNFFVRDDNLHVQGATIERRGEVDYRIRCGTFTTCDGPVPAWKFGAKQVDMTLGGYARARDTVFYLKNVPAFYLPYMIYPTKSERESGLLIPRAGYSDKRGFQYSGAYYQVIDINQDATVYLDYLSEMGLGKGLEYRYIFGRANAGEARVYHIDVDQVDGVPVNEQRYALQWQHDGRLPGDVRMVADILYVNDDEYFDDFGDTAETYNLDKDKVESTVDDFGDTVETYNRDKVESNFFLSRNWGNANLVGQLQYTRDLEADDPTTLQLLPRISFDRTSLRFGRTPLYGTLASEYTHFWRREGLRGQRLMIEPAVSASLQPFAGLTIRPRVSYLERLYWGLSDDSDDQRQGIVAFSTRFNSRLEKIYQLPAAARTKVRHSLEPEVVYRFTPEEDQSALPRFDSYDRIKEQNQLEYALVQRLMARFQQPGEPPNYRELLYLRLAQIYNLTSEAAGQRWEELRGEATLRPFNWLYLTSDVSYDVDQGDWTELLFEGTLRGPRGNQLRLAYRSDRQDIDYGKVDLQVTFLQPVYVNYQQRYDFIEQQQLEQVVSLEYRQQCWSALLTYRERQDDRSVLLTFTMRGIGTVGEVGGSLGGI